MTIPKSVRQIVVAAVFLGLAWGEGQPRCASSKQVCAVFSSLPARFRTQLQNRLILLVRTQKQENWASAYELLPRDLKEKEKKDEFIKRQIELSDWQLLDFQPTKVISYNTGAKASPNGLWDVSGCVLIHKDGKQKAYEGGTSAHLENSEWFLSGVTLTTTLDGVLESCRFKRSNGLLRLK